MKERIGVTNYPLYWPAGWPRAKRHDRARFGDTNTYRAAQQLMRELENMRARKVVISTNLQLRQDGLPYANQRKPADPGVSVWFGLRRGGEWVEHALACDRWDRIEHNLRALVLHVAALRGQERWGVGSVAQAFAGYTAIAERSEAISGWDLLGLDRHRATAEEVKLAWKERARTAHPDGGGSSEAFTAITDARDQCLRELGA